MKKKIFTVITLILVATCFIACTQNNVETTSTSQPLKELQKPFVEVELNPTTKDDFLINDGVIMIYS